MSVKSALQTYGLTNREVDVYLFLLRKPDTTAVTIAKETQIAKTTVYEILETLHEKGLVGVWKKNNVKYYDAESPNQLLRLIDTKRAEVESILPQLLSMQDTNDAEPEVKMYTGKEGIITALDNALEYMKTNQIRTYYSYSHYDLVPFLPKFFPKWLERREALGVRAHVILPKSLQEKLPPLYVQNKYREMRFLNTTRPFEGWFQIYGDTILTVSTTDDNPHAIIIRSPAFANMLQFFHNQVWELLGPATPLNTPPPHPSV
jgi:sugar-specific transcriptional regulator TrmB